MLGWRLVINIVTPITGEFRFRVNTDIRVIDQLFVFSVFRQVIQASFIFEPKLGTITSSSFLLIFPDLDLLNFL